MVTKKPKSITESDAQESAPPKPPQIRRLVAGRWPLIAGNIYGDSTYATGPIGTQLDPWFRRAPPAKE